MADTTIHAVTLLLFNESQKLLLMRKTPGNITLPNKEYRGSFWMPIGGRIEGDETIDQAIARELFEETGLSIHDVKIGRKICYGQLILKTNNQRLITINQQYFYATTTQTNVTLDHLTLEEQESVQELRWFNDKQLHESPEPIYPAILHELVPQLQNGEITNTPVYIDLNLPSPLI